MALRKSLTPWPDVFRTRLVYTVPASGINIGSGTPINYNVLFYGNSLYDPSGSFGSQQPLGFDQLMGLYSYYRVFASKVITRTLTDANTATGTLMHTVVPSIDAAPLASSYLYADQPFARVNWPNFYSKFGPKCTNFMTTKRIWGNTSTIGDSGAWFGTSTTSPSNLWYWHLNWSTADASAMAAANRAWVKVVYWCEFSGITLKSQS